MAPSSKSALAPSVRPLRSPWPWTGLAIALLLTLGPWLLIRRTEQTRLQSLQAAQAASVLRRMEDRMKSLEQVLRGAAGYLGHGPVPSRAEWRTYVGSLSLAASHPGLQGVSFVEWIPGGTLAAHVQRLRSEGFPDYRVVPGGPLPPLPEGFSSILYLEPMDDRNQRAFGKDMLAEAERRAAMLQARDTGQVVLSGKVTLYQETAAEGQAGTVLFAPVYHQGLPVATVADRRRALRGWTTIPMRMTDLMQATLTREQSQADIELFDGTSTTPANLLFDSDPDRPRSGQGTLSTQTLRVAGRTWTVRVVPGPAFFADMGRSNHWEVLIGGLAASLLLFALLVSRQGAEGRARWLAAQRGEEMLATEAQFRAMFECAPIGMAIVDARTGRFLSVNPRLGEILGYATEALLERTFGDVTHPEHLEADLDSVRNLAAGLILEIRREKRYLHRDGHVVWARASAVRLPAAPGASPKYLNLVEDISELRRGAEALRSSEERFRSLFALSPDPITLARLSDGILVMANQAWCDLVGVPEEEALGKSPAALGIWTRPEEREALLAELRRAGRVPPRESVLRHRDGTERQLLITAKRMTLGAEELVLIMGKDVTERHATELALKESEARLRILGDQLTDSFLYQYLARPGETPRFTYLSAGVKRLCGLEAEAVLRDPGRLLGQIDPVMLPAYLEAEAASARDLGPFSMDLRMRRADGAWRWFHTRSTPRAQAGGSIIWEGISTDITEQKLSQLLLVESEARFRNVVETAGEAIYLNDEEGRILLCNRAACTSTGYAMEELLRLRVGDLDAGFTEAQNVATVRALAPGVSVSIQARHRRKDGSTFPVEVRISLFKEEAPRLILAVVRDLGEQEQIRTSELRIRKAESLVLMAGGIAHDFNNLFQAIQGNLELMGLRAKGDPHLAQPLSRAMGVLNRAVSLSWKMLDFSGHGFVQLEAMNLQSWLEAYLATLKLEFPPAFELDLASEPVPMVRGDRSKLEQVVKAVLDNSLEAMPTGAGHGRLRLFVDFGGDRPGPDSPGIWPLQRPQLPATVCLEVADDGAGVPADKLDLICDPFYTTRAPGRGLGLPVLVGILTAHRAGLHILHGTEGGLILRIHFPPSGA